MNGNGTLSKWLFRIIILAMGVIFSLSLFIGAAYATDLTTSSTSLSGYDINPPLVTRVDAQQTAYEGSHTVEAEFIDAESEIDPASDSVTVADAMVTGCQKSNSKISCTATGLRVGDHIIHVSVKDKYGNKKEGDHHVTIIDTVAPIIDSIAASPTNVSVKYHDPAPSSGIKSILVTVDGFELDCCSVNSNRNHDWDNCDYDEHTNGLGPYLGWGHCHHGNGYGYGHDSNSDSFGQLAASCSSIDGTTSCDDDYEREHSAGSIGLTCPILQTLSCGPHQVEVTITDNAGNTTTGTAVLNSDGDCTAPVTTDNAPAGWQNTDVNVTLACTDAGSGCASTTYEVDGGSTQTGNTVSLTTDGTHTITYRSTDVAGNVEATRTATVMIDKTPPVVTTSVNVTVEATGPSGAAVAFTSSATDALSGAGAVSCSAASGDTFPLGASTVTCSASDAAGNTGSATLVVNVVDTTPPVLTLPADFTVAATGTTAVGIFSATATDLVDGTVPVTCSAASGDSFPIGATTVNCSATDSHGNTSVGSFVITVCQSGRPPMELICPTVFGGPDWFWKDQAARIMTIRYTLVNGAGPDAYNVKITSSTANNGVTTLTLIPIMVGDLASGTSIKVSIDYYIPVGVHSMTVANTACADDQCGTTYYYPVTP